MAEAERRARSEGRGDVVEYLNLRAANDEARAVGIAWLLQSFTTLAGELNRHGGASLSVEREDNHRFQAGRSTMVGPRLTFRTGVRRLTIEAGWPRLPQDGIVRRGGLAAARISHFGRPQANEELLLMRAGAARTPQWSVVEETGLHGEPLTEERVRRHLARLLI